MANKNNEDIYCSFCGKWQADLLPATVSTFVTSVLSYV